MNFSNNGAWTEGVLKYCLDRRSYLSLKTNPTEIEHWNWAFPTFNLRFRSSEVQLCLTYLEAKSTVILIEDIDVLNACCSGELFFLQKKSPKTTSYLTGVAVNESEPGSKITITVPSIKSTQFVSAESFD